MSEEAPKRGSRQFGKVESPNLMILRHDEASAPSSHCHKSTQVPTPQLIYFGPATRQILWGPNGVWGSEVKAFA